MAYSLIAHTIQGSADTTTVTTSGINTTGADFLILALARADDATASTISDSKSNSWTALTSYAQSSVERVRLYYSIPTTVGTSHTATCTNGGNSEYPALAFAAFSGAKQTSPFDDESGVNGFAVSSLSVPTKTPSEDNCIIFSACAHADTGTNASVDSSMTLLDRFVESAGSYYALAFYYKIQTTAAAIAPIWSGATLNAATQAIFKAAAAAAVEETIVRQSICIPVMSHY